MTFPTTNPDGAWSEKDGLWWWEGSCPECSHPIDRRLGSDYAELVATPVRHLQSVEVLCNCNVSNHDAALVADLESRGIHATNSGCGYVGTVPTPWAGAPVPRQALLANPLRRP